MARRFAHPKLAVPLVVSGPWLAYFAASGALFPAEFSAAWSSSRQITGMALMYALMQGYLAGFFVYAAGKTTEFIEQLRPLFTGPEAEALVAQRERLRPARFWIATGVGVALGCLNIDWTIVANLGKVPTWPMDLSLVLGSIGVWIVAAQMIYLRSHNALLLARLGRSFVAVDVFQPDRLRAFARVGIVDFLLAMGALAMTPLQALDAEFRWVNYSFAFAIALPAAVALLLTSMWGSHRALQAAKARALAAVESGISVASRDPAGEALTALNALIERRAYLRALHTWPMDLRAISRVGFYMVIPPLAWIAAALVEMGLEAFVAGH